MTATREQVVAEAETWLGTPYHHASNIKGQGVDCGMMMIMVYSALELCPFFDPRPYSRMFHMHRSEEWFLRYVSEHMREVQKPEVGGLALYRVGRIYSHAAIVTAVDGERYTVVHAVVHEGQVQRDDASRHGILKTAPVKFFTMWGD